MRTVNHIVVVRQELVDQNPRLKEQLTDLFERARGSNGASVPPIGVEPNRKAFETLARYAMSRGSRHGNFHSRNCFRRSRFFVDTRRGRFTRLRIRVRHVLGIGVRHVLRIGLSRATDRGS